MTAHFQAMTTPLRGPLVFITTSVRCLKQKWPGNVLLLLALELVVPEMEGEVPEDGRRLQYYRRNQVHRGVPGSR